MPLSFPHTHVKAVTGWRNYHGTVGKRPVATYCTPDAIGLAGDPTPRRFERHTQSITAIIDHCLKQKAPLRVMGSTWSLSRIIEPKDVVIDPANLNVMLRLREEWLTPSYRVKRPATGFTPVFAQSGTRIASINRRLAEIGLALQTSGASDGHRVAGCIATGTHGSAMKIGAVHDTVLALHMFCSATESVVVQPATNPVITAGFIQWLEDDTGLPVRLLSDDQLFGAALVSLGSLGVLHGAVFETVPLYRFSLRARAYKFDDAALWHAVETLDTRPLHPDRQDVPYHFDVILNPHPLPHRMGAFATFLWKEDAGDQPPNPPGPVSPETASDTMGLISSLSELFDDPLSSMVLKTVLSDQLESRYKATKTDRHLFPGQVFGPTALPAGRGTSTEIVVDHARTRDAVRTIYEVLDASAQAGDHLLGAVALRFIPKSKSTLGMNAHAMNTYIEMPSIRNAEAVRIYQACWSALEKAGIPFTCHWGQLHGMSRKRLERYFGAARVKSWIDARGKLLPTATARAVFASPLLAECGLDK